MEEGEEAFCGEDVHEEKEENTVNAEWYVRVGKKSCLWH